MIDRVDRCAHPVTFTRTIDGERIAITNACARRDLAVIIEYQNDERRTVERLAFCGQHCAGDPARDLAAPFKIVTPVGSASVGPIQRG